MKKITDNQKCNIIIIIFSLSILFLMYLFPLLHDDLHHASMGIDFNFLRELNGRYLGNLFAVNLSASIILRVIVKTFIIFSLVIIIKKLLNIKKVSYLLVFMILFLLMPRAMFTQTMPFTSGFTNYMIAIVGILIIMHTHLNDNLANRNLIWALPLIMLGGFNSLFMEHYTLFNLVLSIYFLLYYYIKEKKFNILYLAYFIGSLIGTIVMFSNPIYVSIVAGEDSYRSVISNSELMLRPFVIFHGAFMDNYAINLILVFLITLLYKKKIRNSSILVKVAQLITLLFGLYNILKLLKLISFAEHFEIIMVLLFFASILFLIYTSNLLNKKELYRFAFYIVCMIIQLGPLVFVNPLWARVYAFTYILTIIFVIDFIMEMDKNKLISFEKKEYALFGIVIIQLAIFISIYSFIHIKEKERIDYIREQINKGVEEIKVDDLPYPAFIVGGSICSEYDARIFQRYYNIPSNINLTADCD